MPRYLAIDYLAEYLREKHQKQEEILRLQLPCPDHLEIQGAYPHRGMMPDGAYRRPWQRVNYDKHKLEITEEEDTNQKFLNSVRVYDQLEVLSSDYNAARLDRELCEVVPSSNPESQDLFEEDVLAYHRRETEEIVSEHFEPFDLHNEQVDGAAEDFLVEEVQAADYLDYFRRYLPSIRTLLHRVRPMTLKDPLRSDEYQFFESDRKFENQKDHVEKQSFNPPETEVFSKEEILTLECEPPEEVLLLPSKDVPQEVLLGVSKQDVGEALDGLSKESVEEEEDWGKESTGLINQVDASMLKGAQDHVPEKLDPTDERGTPSFTELNNEGLQESSDAQTSVLESPAIQNPLIVTSNQGPWKDLQPLVVDDAGSWCVLPQEKKDVLDNSLWFYQKFLDNILIQRLREPDVKGVLSETTTFRDVWQQMNLAPELCDELHLPWVPVDYADLAQAGADRVEPYAKGDCGQDKDKERGVKEDFILNDLDVYLSERDIEYELPKVQEKDRKRGNIPDKKVMENEKQSLQLEEKGSGEGLQSRTPFVVPTPSTHQPVGPLLDPTDPLDQFMWMKQRTRTTRRHLGQPAGNISSLSDRISPENKAGDWQSQKHPQTKQVDAPSEKVKQGAGSTTPESETASATVNSVDIVSVEMTGDFLASAVRLREAARPLLQLLQSHGLLPTNQTLAALTPAITRFILKQHKKTCDMAQESLQGQDSSEIPEAMMEIYKAVVGLHALVDALHCLLHGCLPLAAAHLADAHQRHGALPTGLTGVRQDLFETHIRCEQHHVRHPKVLALCERLSKHAKTWNQDEEGKDCKVLVVLNHGSSCLANSVKEGLQMVDGLRPEVCLLQGELTPTHIINSLEKHNCVIVSAAQVTADLHLTRFSYVVEYEHRQGSRLKEMCAQEKINYLGLEMNTENLFREETNDASVPTGSLNQSRPEIILIGSQNVTKETQLLHYLEVKNNILVLERDYRSLCGGQSRLSFADFTVDESVCIVLQDLSELNEVRAASPLVLRLTQLSHKYDKCWLLLHAPTARTGHRKYPYAGMVPSTLARLHAGITHLLSLVQGFDIQVLHSKSAEQTADLVRQISEKAWSASTTWKKDEWLNRTWISPTMSKHEEFMLGIPYINSFSAQILLKIIPVNKLPDLSAQQLVHTCPWISKGRLQAFWKCLHSMKVTKMSAPDPKQQTNSVTRDPRTQAAIGESRDCHVWAPEDVDPVDPYPKATQKNGDSFSGELDRNIILSELEPIVEQLEDECGEVAVPNEYERACWEHHAFSVVTGNAAKEEEEHFNLKSLSQVIHESPEERSFERELDMDRILGNDLKQTVSSTGEEFPSFESDLTQERSIEEMERLLLPELYSQCVVTPNKRSSKQSKSQYDGIPQKVPKVDNFDQGFYTNSHPSVKHKETTLPYPESQTSQAYRDYSKRKGLHLWTQLGDPQEKRSGYQSQRTKSGAVDHLPGRGQRGIPVHRETMSHPKDRSENCSRDLEKENFIRQEFSGKRRELALSDFERDFEATKSCYSKDFQHNFSRCEIFGQGRESERDSTFGLSSVNPSQSRDGQTGPQVFKRNLEDFSNNPEIYDINSRMFGKPSENIRKKTESTRRNPENFGNNQKRLGTNADSFSKNSETRSKKTGYDTPKMATSLHSGVDNPDYPSRSLMPFTPKWSSGGRGIAPVTPKVRVPVRALQLGGEQNDRERGISARTALGSHWESSHTDGHNVSPPMDLSQDDLQQDFYLNKIPRDQQVPQTTELYHHFAPGRSSFSDKVYQREDKLPIQRKLTYEKIPGAPKGQTRLSFM